MRRIIAYGRERHIDVIPNLELYAHLHDLFRVEEYSQLSDLPHGTEFDPSNPSVMALLSDWTNQLADLFPSPFVQYRISTRLSNRNGRQATGFGRLGNPIVC